MILKQINFKLLISTLKLDILRKYIYLMPIKLRKLILVLLDLGCLTLSIYLSFYFCYYSTLSLTEIIPISGFIILTFLLIYFLTGQYNVLTRYVNLGFINVFLLKNSLTSLIIYIFAFIFKINIITFPFIFLFWIFINFFKGLLTLFIKDFLRNISSNKFSYRQRVAIYGAGSAGALLSASLSQDGAYKVILFIDDDNNLWNRNIDGIKIINPKLLSKHLNKIDKIFLSIPSLSKVERKKIFNFLSPFGKEILQVPSLNDITTGRTRISNLKSIDAADLLGRDVVLPKDNLFKSIIENAIVCVTGAGGSIGQEICRQILMHKPKLIILLERNEPSLYYINKELSSLNSGIDIVPILGCATNYKFLDNLIKKYKINIIFHSAAHKHVPIVEMNPLEGLFNNVFSTFNLCEIAFKNNCQRFVLISTDKAVRPTNIMGASKRLAELITLGFAKRVIDEKKNVKKATNYSIVRFGNVLESSGSVVPLFRDQIKNGGPITLTHLDVVRYFMTVSEAAQLVIQASALSIGGELFLLDMGEQIKIKDLAIQMIKLSGLSIKSKENPDGDIEIKIIGLREGEKLYEELLISGHCEKTEHDLIYRAKDENYIPIKLWNKLELLKITLEENNINKSLMILKELVPEWKKERIN